MGFCRFRSCWLDPMLAEKTRLHIGIVRQEDAAESIEVRTLQTGVNRLWQVRQRRGSPSLVTVEMN
jgi:hypothetical protein